MMTSYDTNVQVHWIFDPWEKHGGKCVYIRIPESLFDIFMIVFIQVYVLDVQIKLTTVQYFI